MGRNLLRRISIGITLFSLHSPAGALYVNQDYFPVEPGQNSPSAVLNFESGATDGPLSTLQAMEGPSLAQPDFSYFPGVEKAFSYYSTGYGYDTLADALDAAYPFRSLILQKIHERKLPEELLYVALLESTFDPKALSKSGAAGMWQFMDNSIGNLLVKNSWLDERYDFWKATDAALVKLAWNYEQFGDWRLALAAYNAGDSRISRLIKLHGTNRFEELAAFSDFPAETREYVPRIVAIAMICEHLGSMGFPVDWRPAFEWSRIPVTGGLVLADLEERAGLAEGTLAMMNAELIQGKTAPSQKGYLLKIPTQFSGKIRAALLDLQKK